MVQLPVQVTFRNMPPSETIEAEIHRRASRLDTFFDRIMACRVMVEIPHRHHRHGQRYHVRVDLTVPGNEMVVSRSPNLHGANKHVEPSVETKDDELGGPNRDLYIALDEAFDEIQRRLQDWVERRRGRVKNHRV